MKKLRSIFKGHWNCLSWFISGIAVILDGEVTVWQFFGVWVVILWYVWRQSVK